MKKSFLFAAMAILLISCTQDNPQPPTMLYDSIYVFDVPNERDTRLLYKYYYQYDDAGNQIEQILNGVKFTSTFDANRNLVEQIRYTSNNLGEWLLTERELYAYNSKNQRIRMDLYQSYEDTQSTRLSAAEYTYSKDGNTRYETRYLAHPNTDTIWYKGIIQFNSHGDPVEIIDSMLLSEKETWVSMLYATYTYTYDSHNNVTYVKEVQADNKSDEYRQMEENTYAYEYDSEGRILTRTQHYHYVARMSGNDINNSYTRKYMYFY